jgi:hypothetical protein
MKRKVNGKKNKFQNRRKNTLRRDRLTVSMISDHLVFSPKYRGKVLIGEVAVRTE